MPEKLEGRKVAVVGGTAHEAYLKALFPEAELRPYPNSDLARLALRRGDVDLLFGDAIALAFWLNGTSSENCCVFRGGALSRQPLFRRGHRHRGAQGQRPDAADAELGAVPDLGAGPFHRPVAAVFPDQPVLITSRPARRSLAIE